MLKVKCHPLVTVIQAQMKAEFNKIQYLGHVPYVPASVLWDLSKPFCKQPREAQMNDTCPVLWRRFVSPPGQEKLPQNGAFSFLPLLAGQ